MTWKPKPEVAVLTRLMTAHFALREAAKVATDSDTRLAIEGWQFEVEQFMQRLTESLGLPSGAVPGVPTVAQWQNLFTKDGE